MENSILYVIGGIIVFVLIGLFVMKFLLRSVFKKFGFDKNSMSQMGEKAINLYKTENLQNTTRNAVSDARQIDYADYIKETQKDTIGWEKFLVYIHGWREPVEVIKNGNLEGYLLDIEVKPAGVFTGNFINPLGGLSIVRNCYFPKSYLHSFGKYTQMMVLYNPKNPKEIIPDPENENWHYEVK